MRVILDTNVIVASFATRGLCSAVFELCLDRFDIVTSPFLRKEVESALLKKIRMPGNVISELVNFLTEHSISFEVRDIPRNVCRDPDDAQLLALAEVSGADYLVTGDKDLLILKKYCATKIVTPRKLWESAKKF
jgi:putative PIN family toxin of toxin-antitoxin system